MKILTLDIENRPNMAYVWGLFNQNISIGQVAEHAETFSFAAKWHHKKQVEFYSTFHHGKEEMVGQAHRLLDEADVVVGYNSKNFDLKHLNREIVLAELDKPSPYQQVDLLHVVRSQFRFTSNKLDYVAQQFGLGAKTSHSGFDLWLRCMQGDEKAWALMRKYNKQDVVLTEALYDRLRPWVPNHPSVPLHDGTEGDACRNCGGVDLRNEGYAYTSQSKFQRFQCRDCGRWGRATKAIARVHGV